MNGKARRVVLATVIMMNACGQGPSADGVDQSMTESASSGRDYAAIQEQRAQQMEAIADTFREEQGDALLTTADQVIQRYVEAVGGREAFDTIQTMVVRLSGHGPMGRVTQIVRYYKRPLHYRQEVVGSDVASVTDGRRLWRAGPEGWAQIGGTAYFPLASIDGHFIDYESWGVSYEFTGVLALDGDPGYTLQRTWPDGSSELLFFSASSGLLTAAQSEYVIHPKSWFSYWDYRDVGGIRIPYVTIRSVGELGPPHGAVVESVEINVPLADSLFSPPEGG